MKVKAIGRYNFTMGEQELAIQNNSRNKQHITLAIFVLVLFFSLFSISSLLLWHTTSSFVELLVNPRFISRIITVVISFISFSILRRVNVLKSITASVFIYCLSVVFAFGTLFFARGAEAELLYSPLPLSPVIIFSSFLLVSQVTDDKKLVLEDIFLSSFVEGLSVMLLLMNNDYAGAIICFFVLTCLFFTFSFTFGVKVLLLTLFSVSCIITLLMLSPSFVKVYFTSISQSGRFMNFFRQTETFLSPHYFNDGSISKQWVVFALLYRFKTVGVAVYVLGVLALDVLLFSLSAKYAEEDNLIRARYIYALSLYIAFNTVCVLLSLATSLPFFSTDPVFLTSSDLAVFVLISSMGVVFER